MRARPARLAAAACLVALALAGPAAAQSGAAKPAPASPATQPTPPSEGPPALRPWTGDLDGMIARRVIRVVTTYSRTNYFVDKGVQRGATYEAMKAFEDELNARRKTGLLRVHVVVIPVSRDELLPALLAGRGDVAAAALTITPEREKQVDFTVPVTDDVSEIAVTGPNGPALGSVDDLSGREVFVRRSSSYHESLVALNARLAREGKKPVTLRPAPETLEDEDLLEMVNAGLVKIVVVDSYLAAFWKKIFPKLTLHPDVAVRTEGKIAWAIRPGSPKLKAALDDFVRKHAIGTKFGNIVLQKYLKSTKFVKSATGGAELKRFQSMVDLFRKYGDRYDVDWLLMTAQGFQESGLDQAKKSPVGAIGVMQVMPATGKDMKVGDIRQLEANIHAGVKYIRFMVDQYYADEPMTRIDKALFAFASYNAGPARVRSLRREAEKRGLDPNRWFNNVERIAAEKIGRETVQYVSNIYKYYVAYTLVMEEQAEREKAKESLGTAPTR
jgi:membrane-bound lytic murein transglycosylase MltF